MFVIHLSADLCCWARVGDGLSIERGSTGDFKAADFVDVGISILNTLYAISSAMPLIIPGQLSPNWTRFGSSFAKWLMVSS